MENLRYPIKLNMENTGSLLTSIRLKQGDSAIIFVLRIFKNGQNVFSVDDIPSIVFNRPDGSAVVGECSVAEGQYTYKILGNELQYPGQIRADVKFDIYTETESSTTFLFECVKDTLPQNIHGAGIYVNSLKNIKDYLDQTVIKLEQELDAFDLQQVLDAVNYVQKSADKVETLMPEIRDVTDDISSINSRIDNLVVSSGGDSPIEVIDAHVGTNGTTYNTLKARLDAENTELKGELQDIRVKADGTTAENAGNAVREQFNELKSDLVNFEERNKIKPSKNIICVEPLIDKYVGINGVIDNMNGCYAYIDIPCKPNTTYIRNDNTIVGYCGYCVFLDMSKNVIGNNYVEGERMNIFTTPNDCYYISTYSWRLLYNYDLVIIEGESFQSGVDYLPYDLKLETDKMTNNEIVDMIKNGRKLEFHVALDGSGDYTNLKDCFDYIYSLNDDFDSCIVYLHEGGYDVRAMFTDQEWNNTDMNYNHYWGLTVPDNVSLVGYGKRENIALYSNAGMGTSSTTKAVLNFKNSGNMENIGVFSGNLRYCVHDDMAWSGKPYTRIIKNCLFSDIGSTYMDAYGAGTNGYGNIEFNNCIFKSDVGTIPFSYHNGANQKVPTNIKMIGCKFETSNAIDCQFPSQSADCDCNVTMIGCRLKSIKFHELESGCGLHFTLNGGGNSKNINKVVENADGKTYTFSFADE